MKTIFEMDKGVCVARWYCHNAGKEGCNPTKRLWGFLPLVSCDNFKEKVS